MTVPSLPLKILIKCCLSHTIRHNHISCNKIRGGMRKNSLESSGPLTTRRGICYLKSAQEMRKQYVRMRPEYHEISFRNYNIHYTSSHKCNIKGLQHHHFVIFRTSIEKNVLRLFLWSKIMFGNDLKSSFFNFIASSLVMLKLSK